MFEFRSKSKELALFAIVLLSDAWIKRNVIDRKLVGKMIPVFTEKCDFDYEENLLI